MKILIAGDGHSDIHEEPLAAAFKSLGHEVVRFDWYPYFKVENFFSALQNKFLWGPRIDRLNRDLLNQVLYSRADLVFVYRGTHIRSSTLKQIRVQSPHTSLVGYNNDDPFSAKASRFMWRHFLASIRFYDLVLAYRHRNLAEFKAAGAKRVELLRSWYIPEKNRPVELSLEERRRFGSDVSWIGHYEDDGRDEYIVEILRSGFNFKLFGPDWSRDVLRFPELQRLAPIQAVRGEDYNKAINATKIALCFLSKINRDTYTRRCFEIPAAKGFLLAEYSEDLANLFKEGSEIEFFRSKKEMIQKIDFYLKNPARREAIAEGGYQRVIRDGHDVISRAREILKLSSLV